MVAVADVAARIEDLEASNSVASRVLSIIERDDVGAREVATVVSADPVLVQRIMRMANSTFYGTGGRIEELHVGISVIGFLAVRSLALAALVDGVAPVTPQDWVHSVTVAVGASEIARRFKIDHQLAFSVGLLHDLGRALMASFDREYRSLLLGHAGRLMTAQEEEFILREERRRFTVNHAQLGGDILEYWNFSRDLCQAVANHHNQKGSISRVHAAVVDGDRLARLLRGPVDLAEAIRTPDVLLPFYISLGEIEEFGNFVVDRSNSILLSLF
ncbi:MAG: HDOD domain-containing protein [Ferrimicrobium sp.]